MNTASIKDQIPNWLTDVEVDRLRSQFDPVIQFAQFVDQTRNPGNWKRMYKVKTPENFPGSEGIERGFDCRPFEDQLRLYVLTDPLDQQVKSVLFQTE